jgi:heme exporter protein A
MTQPSGALLEVQEIDLWRGERQVLRNVSCMLRAAQLLRVTGPNGAGKTSLLRVICGLMPAENGRILWRGRQCSRGEAREQFHGELAYLAHSNAIKLDLTAIENLHYSVELRLAVERRDYRSVLEGLGLGASESLPGRALSAGQRRRHAFARVLLSGAVLWVLDEPTTNLDTDGCRAVEDAISAHLDSGGCVLAATHAALLTGDARSSVMELE